MPWVTCRLLVTGTLFHLVTILQHEKYRIKTRGISKSITLTFNVLLSSSLAKKLTSNSLIFSSAILCFSKSWLWITPLGWRINLRVKKKRQKKLGAFYISVHQLHTSQTWLSVQPHSNVFCTETGEVAVTAPRAHQAGPKGSPTSPHALGGWTWTHRDLPLSFPVLEWSGSSSGTQPARGACQHLPFKGI